MDFLEDNLKLGVQKAGVNVDQLSAGKLVVVDNFLVLMA